MKKAHTLKNGLKYIKIPLQSTKAITLMALFPVGSRYENKKISGASHFVEHMLFKGTKKRPTYIDISKELDSVGAEYNAFTNKDYTGYYIKINSAKQELAFDMLSDILFNSNFDKEEVEKEKGVIVEELRMYEDNPTYAVDNLFDQTFFRDHPLGWDIGGTIKTVKGISRDELYDYYKKYYHVGNMILVVSGNIDKKDFFKNIKYFNVHSDKAIGLKKVRAYKKYTFPKGKISPSNRVGIKRKKTDQAHVVLGFPGLRHDHKDKYALAVLTSILSGGMSSRLFVEVREKRGLAYAIGAGVSPYRDVGVFEIKAGLDPARLEEAMRVIRDELIKIKKQTVSIRELTDAKNYIIGHMALSLEDSSTQAEWHAKGFWFNKKIFSYSQVAREIKKVSQEDVRALAGRIFDIDNMRMAVISNLTKQKLLKII
ncbi:MAG: pitrilysin family protein [bacterium]